MLEIEPSVKTPHVRIDFESATVSIEGVCTPENPTEFFLPISTAIYKILDEKNNLDLNIFLEYFNSGSSVFLLQILKNISLKQKEKKVNITWSHESDDDDLKEAGQLFSELCKLHFNYIVVNN